MPTGDKSSSPFSLSIAAPQSTFKSGSEVRISVTITNTSAQQASFIFLPNAPQFDLYVRDSSGKLAPETAYGKTVHPWSPDYVPSAGSTLAARAILKSGEKTTIELDVSRQYELTRPGEYTLSVQSTQAGIVLKSNTARVTITP